MGTSTIKKKLVEYNNIYTVSRIEAEVVGSGQWEKTMYKVLMDVGPLDLLFESLIDS